MCPMFSGPGPVTRAPGRAAAERSALLHQRGVAAENEDLSAASDCARAADVERAFAVDVEVGMVGVNFAIPVPLAYYTFGGWKRSGFGDLNQHGPDAVRFYTKTKTVTARWPSGVKEGAEFVIPTMK